MRKLSRQRGTRSQKSPAQTGHRRYPSPLSDNEKSQLWCTCTKRFGARLVQGERGPHVLQDRLPKRKEAFHTSAIAATSAVSYARTSTTPCLLTAWDSFRRRIVSQPFSRAQAQAQRPCDTAGSSAREAPVNSERQLDSQTSSSPARLPSSKP